MHTTKHKCTIFFGALLLGFVAALHAYRLTFHIPMNFDGEEIPLWISLAAIILAGSLSYSLFAGLSCKKCK